MSESRARIDTQAREFFDGLWRQGDYWELRTSPFERARLERQLSLIAGRRYGRALELGCGTGEFSVALRDLADVLVAIDISPTAIARAVETTPRIDFRVANIMDHDLQADGPWDLIVLSETMYYLGWLYPFADVAWRAAEMFHTTRVGGRLLLANTSGGVEDGLIRPWLVRTYRDLFVNVGYALEKEEVFTGTKHGVDIEIVMTLFVKLPTPEE
jgi:SAM-dependent methyltransferase